MAPVAEMDFTILASPRMSEGGFATILERASSPASGESVACYAAFAERGVDPCLALAVFSHESSFGEAGIARETRSWGNIRRAGAFVSYASWADGARDAAALLAIYGHNLIVPGRMTATARSFPHVWAPTADGNDPASYGLYLVDKIVAWSGEFPPVKAPAAGLASGQRYTVAPGDTLWAIAQAHGVPWQAIYAASRDVVGPDPDLIHPGQVLTIPSPAAAAVPTPVVRSSPGPESPLPSAPAPAQPGPRRHTVQPGDTLWSIAEDALGGPFGAADDAAIVAAVAAIFHANRGVIGSNPDLIHPGQQIEIPASLGTVGEPLTTGAIGGS